MNHPPQLNVRIALRPMPDLWSTHPRTLSVGLQSGSDDIVRGTETVDNVDFELVVGVKRGRDGAPDFTGPFVHGRPGERFLYLSWGAVTAETPHHTFRRLKLYLSPVSRAGWSSPGVSWDQITHGTIATTVSGREPDGTPHCATAALVWG